ncbi:hypothetical protein ACM46_14275 [Chryseobacterium angstadtii]|uniref:Uncharacterized protein n=1 Tax=Chryseobacterium angstadtii TaxID=558151 RepID=A0A0J7I9X8_9FLAO|nr:DUF5829 family protein [Chryseobacterium angstadtii]KMQ63102.1 hypothetical protein ACM46_14275 [Chryseobacterium angstadtii]
MIRNLFFFIFLLMSGFKAFGQDEGLKLNHIYFVLDSADFESIKTNKQLANWANLDKGLPGFDPVDEKTTTVYLRGKSTYLEIMGPDNKFGEKTGAVGIGFSWDVHAPFSDNINEKLKKKGLKFERSESMWNFGNEKILWYSAYYTHLKGSAATWYAFYNPEFLTHLYHTQYSSFRREDFLEKKMNADKEIKDLSGIVLDCNPDDYKKIAEELRSFGVKIKVSGKNFITFETDSVEIRLNQTELKKTVLRELQLKTGHELKENLKIGNLQLENRRKELVIKLH